VTTEATIEEFFEHKYRAAADPWNFATSPYEQQRYQVILRAIEHRRYRRALEPGCSVGVLTSGLASLCDEVAAFDIAPSAVAAAREECRGFANVHLTCNAFAEDGIDGQFDLIVLSEIGYYFEVAKLRKIVISLMSHLSPGGVIVAAHWLGTSRDHVLKGDSVHDLLRSTLGEAGLVLELGERYQGFRLDRWSKPALRDGQPATNREARP
jgi:2-polyprenyl-3-methyl-5-hydroxy-6-metoxy-1,4-benzoquinol methylase